MMYTLSAALEHHKVLRNVDKSLKQGLDAKIYWAVSLNVKLYFAVPDIAKNYVSNISRTL